MAHRSSIRWRTYIPALRRTPAVWAGRDFAGLRRCFRAAARHRSMPGQLAFQYQAVSGAVDISTTPVVEYTYSSLANGSRITSMVYPKCPDFSEANAKEIADDVLKSDDPDIRNLLNDVLNSVTQPSPYYQQMANTFENAGGNLIATAKPESAPVENIYNGLGQLAFQYQAATGAVDISTTPVVEYTYSSPSNGSRLTSMVYPDNKSSANQNGDADR